MITIVDYGLGNVRAFLNVYRRLNIEANTARNREELEAASKLILPGVGSFDHAMGRLNGSGMRETLDELVLGQDSRARTSGTSFPNPRLLNDRIGDYSKAGLTPFVQAAVAGPIARAVRPGRLKWTPFFGPPPSLHFGRLLRRRSRHEGKQSEAV